MTYDPFPAIKAIAESIGLAMGFFSAEEVRKRKLARKIEEAQKLGHEIDDLIRESGGKDAE